MKTIEILAPAGSYESMVGAFNAGADAVYMGGQQFGARAYADNPDENGLLSAIDYAHIHGKKLYLTVNTLQKDEELETQLYNYLYPLYIQGLDAVIVQDMGVLQAIRGWFPEMAVHASTQMTVVAANHARRLKELGVTRIVPARELRLDEICQIKEQFQGEIECFVHGALCYCYSGQCLMSSMIGGRSGNRGRCAQPCRLPYRLLEDGRKISSDAAPYLLSPKDICTLEMIPQLVEAGIDSFKIEGRMKKPEYAAFVSYMYRKYTDLYLSRGKEGYHVAQEDIRALMELYNRGGFSSGYFGGNRGPKMMSMARPNHFGSEVGQIVRSKGIGTHFVPDVPIAAGDLLLAEGMADASAVTAKEPMLPGHKYTPGFPTLLPGTSIYRLRSEHLLKDIREHFLNVKKQEKLYISLTLLKELPAKMQVTCEGFTAEAYGPAVEAAAKLPLTREVIWDKLKKTGNTPFMAAELELVMDDDAYLPLTALNQLRRSAVEALTETIQNSFRRQLPLQQQSTACPKAPQSAEAIAPKTKKPDEIFQDGCRQRPLKTALVSSPDILNVLLEIGGFDEIYLESWMIFSESFARWIAAVKAAGIKAGVALPYIFRSSSQKQWTRLLSVLKACEPDAYLVRNMESLEFIREHQLLDGGAALICDYTLYTMNRRARAYYQDLGARRVTVPVELNYPELLKRGCAGDEMIVYGFLPLMVSAGCLYENVARCEKVSKNLSLTDRYHKSFRVRNVCTDCYNLIYNSQPTVLYDMESKLSRLQLGAVRYNFTDERPEMVRGLLEQPVKNRPEAFTRGHFNRGVE